MVLNSDPHLSSTVCRWVVNILLFPYTFIGTWQGLHGPSFEIKSPKFSWVSRVTGNVNIYNFIIKCPLFS